MRTTKQTRANKAASNKAADPKAAPTAAPAKQQADPERRERLQAARDTVATLYGGASLTVHRSARHVSLAEYADRVRRPVQTPRHGTPTVRDDSVLLTIYGHFADKPHNPDHYGADLGAISRNASLGRLAVNSDGLVYLTERGVTDAKAAIARAAKIKAAIADSKTTS